MPAAAHDGWGIVSDPRGRIFFTDLTRNIVWRLDPDGTLVAVREQTHSHALVSLGDGSVYGVHVDATEPIRSVWQLDADGAMRMLLPPTRDLPLGLQSFLIDTDGTMYSAIGWAPERRVSLLRRGVNGLAERIANGFTGIDGMAWAPDGAILLTDGPYLKRLTIGAEGSEIEVLGGGALTETRWGADLMGVTTDGSGGALVADFSGGRVLAIGRRSGVALQYVPNFPWSPTGIARDANGLVVLEHVKMPWAVPGHLQVGPYLRIRRLGLDSSVRTLVVLWGTRTWIVAAGLAMLVVAGIGWRLRTYHQAATHK
jgi:hypothetical protein